MTSRRGDRSHVTAAAAHERPAVPRPFAVAVPERILADLRERLKRTRWPDEIPAGGWTYGTDLSYLKELVAYWRTEYDWREQERRINSFRQFTVPMGGIELHFIHEPGVGPNPLPLLISHGWPSSVVEFHKIIFMLTDPARSGGDPGDAFTVIAPSLPGFGYSFHPGQPRLGITRTADLFGRLMTDVLGFRRFGAQGGDLGAFIASSLAMQHAERLHGIHLSLLPFPRDLPRPSHPTPEEAAYFERLDRWLADDAAYVRIQGTRPQTIAYALTDSPAGLAGWIVEKFRAWSDCGGDVERRFTKDELLTNVMLYWSTGAINSSFWPYYERLHSPWPVPFDARIDVPTAYADFPHEIVRQPRAWAERVFDVRRWTTMSAGGHFPALEEPEALVADIREFFRTFRSGDRS